MKGIPFAARLAAVMVGVVFAASVLLVSMNMLKFRRVLRQQEDLVYAFVAADLRDTIEDSINLGLPLAALQSTEQLLQRRRALDPAILGISVYDAGGTVLFDTDRFRIQTAVPDGWRPSEAAAHGWTAELRDAGLVGAAVTNSFGQRAGGVVVRYDLAALYARMNSILLDMVRTALLALAGTTAVAVLAAVLLTRGYRAWFARATAQLLDGAARPAPAAPGLDAVIGAMQQASLALDEAEASLMRLGSDETQDADGRPA